MALYFITVCLLAISNVVYTRREKGNIELNDGKSIPPAAYGTYLPDLNRRREIVQAVIWAIEAGYRHIDTAHLYLTEDVVGDAVRNVLRRKLVRRDQLYITTKLPITVGTREEVVPAVKKALKRFKLEYVDLYLIHTPDNVLNLEVHDYLEIWRGLEDAKTMGLVRSIGVSNFNGTQINRLLANSETPPAVNQIEVNPTFTNLELVAYCQCNDIVVSAYAPFGFLVPRPGSNVTLPPTFDDPILVEMANRYRANVSQIVLRYLVDCDIIPIARSVNRKHIESNIDIFDFSLSQQDVLTINEFDKNTKVYSIDYEGLRQSFVESYTIVRSFIEQNNLTQYL